MLQEERFDFILSRLSQKGAVKVTDSSGKITSGTIITDSCPFSDYKNTANVIEVVPGEK